ncbi:MAG: hypothetical protein RLZ83_2249 [Pseudomonadota bacterium]|jgi:hypothetical protein
MRGRVPIRWADRGLGRIVPFRRPAQDPVTWGRHLRQWPPNPCRLEQFQRRHYRLAPRSDDAGGAGLSVGSDRCGRWTLNCGVLRGEPSIGPWLRWLRSVRPCCVAGPAVDVDRQHAVSQVHNIPSPALGTAAGF